MRILIVFTGGTIGCSPPDREGIMSVKGDYCAGKTEKDYYLLKQYRKRNDSSYGRISFETIEPLRILSENMTVAHCNSLITALANVDYSAYKGIIITHGTDTMAYSAPLFGMILAGIKIPVVFVGSNINLYDENTDGHRNFSDAVDFICNYDYCGTFVIFGSTVFLSTRIKQSKHFTNNYESTNGIDFGVMENGVFKPNMHPCNPDKSNLRERTARTPLINKVKALTDCVLMIKPYIGLRYDVFDLNSEIKAVLHETYHSFTACADGNSNCSIISFAGECIVRGIELYAAPFAKTLISQTNALKYSSSEQIIKSGVQFICDMSIEAAYAKLLIACNLYDDGDEIKKFLDETVFFETV